MNTLASVAGVSARLTLVSGEGVWIPDDALAQLERIRALPGCIAAVGMPDLHAGPGSPIGAALAFRGVLYPELIGSDIGCGARLTVTRQRRVRLDALERRLREEFAEGPMPWDEDPFLLDALAERGCSAFANCVTAPASARQLAVQEPAAPPICLADLVACDLEPASHLFRHSLGTIGGGNHFAEVTRVRRIVDKVRAAPLGLVPGAVAVLVHTGSRGLGKHIALRFGPGPLSEDNAARYLLAHEWACRFAQANRWLLSWRVLAALGEARPEKIALAVDCVHNEIAALRDDHGPVWLHRKGAALAAQDQPTLLLGSRGACSWLLVGRGTESSLWSTAHGAGRRMSRADALTKLKAKHDRESLQRTPFGGRVLCDRTELLYEEHPDAYKPIEPVLRAVTAADLAAPVAELEPLFTVKQ